jgi:hypothetical protein
MSGRGILDADMQTVGGWIADGTRWWLGQLRAMVPARLADAMQPAASAVDYAPGPATFEPEPPRGKPWTVLLPPGLALVREVELPAVAPRALDAMVRLEADRLMPFPPGMAAVIAAAPDARGGAAGSSTGRRLTTVAGLSPEAARALAAAIADRPASPIAVLAPLPKGGHIDLLPALARAGLVPDEAARARLWWTIVAALFALNLALIVWRDVAAIDRLNDVIEQQQPALTIARRITGRIRADTALAGSIAAERKVGEPLALMGKAAAALPPGVWLQRWGWQDGAIHLAGMRPPQADIAGALRKAGFEPVRYADGAGDSSAETAGTPLGIPFDIVVSAPGAGKARR